MPLNYIEFGLEADGAEVLATAKENAIPVAFVNEYGKGLAVYIACDLPTSYFLLNGARGIGSNSKYAAEAEDFITAICNKAGVTRRLGLEPESDDRVSFSRPVMFTQGDIRYFGLLRQHGLAKDFAVEPVGVKVSFPAKGYVRELFTETDYGLTDQVDALFKPTTLLLYSWSPYRVDGIDLALSKQSAAPGDVISYEVALKSEAAMSTHTLHLGVFDPDGEDLSPSRESKPYSHNITAPGGKAKGVIPLALNDKKGTWKIQIKDLVSGATTETTFAVE